MEGKIDNNRLQEQQQNVILDLQNRLETWKTFQSDYQSLEDTLKLLPEKISHDVMVPFGSMAFMPGKLVHTNEILVLLGDNWFAKRSASQALDIVKRRKKYVDENIESICNDLEFFSSQLSFTQEKVDSDVIEIKEEIKGDQKHKAHGTRIAYEKAKQFAPKKVKKIGPTKPLIMTEEEKELFAKLQKLEVMEVMNKELENLDTLENDSEHINYRSQEILKQTEVRFADDVMLEEGTDSDDSSETEDQETTKTIVVNFTTPTSGTATENMLSCSSESIQTPTDIYSCYKPTPKSILKKSSIEKESFDMTSHQETYLRTEIHNDTVKAFSGEIIETPSHRLSNKKFPQTKPKRVSKFKAERKSQSKESLQRENLN